MFNFGRTISTLFAAFLLSGVCVAAAVGPATAVPSGQATITA